MNENQKIEGSNKSDLANSERLARSYCDVLKYVRGFEWLSWNGKYWEQNDNAPMQSAKKCVLGIYNEVARIESKDEREEMVKWAKSSESQQKLYAMVNLAKSHQSISARPEIFDADPLMLNVKNGILNLRDRSLTPHFPGAYMTKISGASYRPGATCPNWLEFLDRIFEGNEQLINFVQRSVGYALTGDASEKIFFLAYGPTDTGKSTFINTIQKLLGDYALTTNASTFMTKSGNGANNDIARLKGARFVCAVESESNQRMATAIVKSMTGRDRLSARYLFKEYFDFTPQFKVWLATNHKPKVSGNDDAIWRRIKLIPFTVQIPLEEQDPHFADILESELDGILSWAIEGCIKWQQSGLQIPEEVVGATREYQQEQDTIQQAFDDCFIARDGIETQAIELYLRYTSWCAKAGETPEKQREFWSWLDSKGFASRRTSKGVMRQGIGLLA